MNPGSPVAPTSLLLLPLFLPILLYPWPGESRLPTNTRSNGMNVSQGQGETSKNTPLLFEATVKRMKRTRVKNQRGTTQPETLSSSPREYSSLSTTDSSADPSNSDQSNGSNHITTVREAGAMKRATDVGYFPGKTHRKADKTHRRDGSHGNSILSKSTTAESGSPRQSRNRSLPNTGSNILTNHASYIIEDTIFSNKTTTHDGFHSSSSTITDFDNRNIPQTWLGPPDYLDRFRCGSCMCSHDNEELIIANCTFRQFHYFPLDIPKTVIQLNISNNYIHSLKQTKIVALEKLHTLSMRNNRVNRINVTKREVSSLEVLDLSYNRIEHLQDNAFSFLTNLKHLSLEGNHLMYIKKVTFENFTNLQVLNLGYNRLKHFDGSAFDSLTELQELYLFGNTFMGYRTHVFPPRLFDKTKKLTFLSIQGSSGGKNVYPVEALTKLKHLYYLNIDVVHNSEFLGPAISDLESLKILEFGPRANCHSMKMIPADFFQCVPYIEVLTFDHCIFFDLNPAAYAKLPNLKKLSYISLNMYPLNKALEDLIGLQNSSLEYLKLSRLNYYDTICIFLKGENAKYLKNITTLKELDLSSNGIALVQRDFIQALPKSIQILILRNNDILKKNGGGLWYNLYLLSSLVTLDVSNQGIPKRGRKSLLQNTHSENTLEKEYVIVKTNKSLGGDRSVLVQQPEFYFVQTYHVSPEDDKDYDYYDEDYYHNENDYDVKHSSFDCNSYASYRVKERVRQNSVKSRNISYNPKSLKYVMSSRYDYFGYALFYKHYFPNNIEYVSLTNSVLTEWGYKKLNPRNVFVDLSKNNCHHLNVGFFPPNNSLVHISMSANLLGNAFSTIHYGHFFRYLDKTQYMDISLNFIYHLPYTFLKGLTSLETLMMTDNRLQILNISFSETPNLRILDVRQNSISWISKQSRDELDQIALRHPLTLAIGNNPILCTCRGIETIKWMAMTNVHLLDKTLLECHHGHGRLRLMGDLSVLHKSLQSQCADSNNIIISCSIIISFIVLILACYYVGKRYRWWFYVKYKKHALYTRWFGFKPKEQPKKEYRYDAYLCYSDKDRKLAIDIATKLDTTVYLFIPDRHILYGTCEVSGMTSGVMNSYKFLIVFTENFKEHLRTDFKDSGMLEYTIMMALFEERSCGRQMLHVMQFADISVQGGDDIPMYLAHVLEDPRRQTRFPYVHDPHVSPEAVDYVWECLSASIGQQETEREEGAPESCS